MAFDKELYKALKAGLADLTEPQNQALRLIWENPNVPVYNLPIKIGRQPSGYVWLAVGAGIKTKLWRRMPPQIKREVQPPGYLPFYVGLLVRLYTVEDRHQRRLKVFELHAEAVKALQELKIIGTKRDQPSPDYKRLDKMEDDEVPTGSVRPLKESASILRS
jgi:hypothetical protein